MSFLLGAPSLLSLLPSCPSGIGRSPFLGLLSLLFLLFLLFLLLLLLSSFSLPIFLSLFLFRFGISFLFRERRSPSPSFLLFFLFFLPKERERGKLLRKSCSDGAPKVTRLGVDSRPGRDVHGRGPGGARGARGASARRGCRGLDSTREGRLGEGE